MMEAAAEKQPDQVPQEVPAPENAAPEVVPEVVPAPVVVREVDAGQAARHEVRMARQVAIRHGLYLPPLPAPHLPFPQAEFGPRNVEMIDDHREHLMAQLRVENFRFLEVDGANNDYRPLSPDNSDDEEDEVMEAHQRQRRMRHQWGHYMHHREAPLPQGIVDQLLGELDRNVRRFVNNLPHPIPGNNNRFNNNNNNGNFRNFNGVLSPSPSPSPGATPEDSEDEEPMMGGDAVVDEDVEMLNVAFEQMQPNHSRARKRQTSREPVAIKKKRVTFKTDSDDEAPNSDDEDFNGAFKARNVRKENEDDDEGFFGGPSRMHRNVSCA